MFGALLDFFCSRPFPEKLPLKQTLFSLARAIFWGVVACVVGLLFAEKGVIAAEHVATTGLYSGALVEPREAFPLLQMIIRLFLGETPSIVALNCLGAIIGGLLVACTWGVVRFWVLDAANDESVVGAHRLISPLAADVACVAFIFSLPGLFTISGLSTTAWGFMLFLLCILLQNRYVLNGGHRYDMALFGFVLGIATVESHWVLLFLPVFFLRVISMEWRLWDHNVRNLPLWFIAFIGGIVLTLTVMGDYTPIGLVANAMKSYKALMPPTAWILVLAGTLGLPLISWITSRRLLNNDRSVAILLVGVILTFSMIVLIFGIHSPLIPIRVWLSRMQIPLATGWINAVVFAMLLVGWGVLLFVKNANTYEEQDRNYIPKAYSATRVGAFFCFPLAVLVLVALVVFHTQRFMDGGEEMRKHHSDAAMSSIASQFAEDLVKSMAVDAPSLAANHTYLVGSRMEWLNAQLSIAATRQGVPLTLFLPQREGDKLYLHYLRDRVCSDPRLEGSDRILFEHILDHNLALFIQDFYVTQANIKDIAAVLDVADLWYATRLRPISVGGLMLGLSDQDCAAYADRLWEEHLAFRKQWGFVANYQGHWWDMNTTIAEQIAHHLAFITNNLGTYFDDMGMQLQNQTYLKRAADCYRYAHQLHAQNVSAILNYYAICHTRGFSFEDNDPIVTPEDHARSAKDYENFLREIKKRNRKYDLSKVNLIHGYIRDAQMFAQSGLEWVISAAPDAALAALRNAQSYSRDSRLLAQLGSAIGSVFESRGMMEQAQQEYQGTILRNPNDIVALRGLARLALQRGNTQEAGQYLARAESQNPELSSLDIDRAAYLMAIGDFTKARDAISRYTTTNKDDVIGWAMLGMLEVEDGNLDRARGFIAENIKRTSPKNDQYFSHVLAGRIAFAMAQKYIEKGTDERGELSYEARSKLIEARDQYRRAYANRSNVAGLLQMILQIDFLLKDGTEAELDAIKLRHIDPENVLALYALGMKRLEEAHIDEARNYFTRAVKNAMRDNLEMRIELIVNTADVLSRSDDMASLVEAERLALDARRRMSGTPGEYVATGTYAMILARMKKFNQARTILAEARKLPHALSEPRLDFVDAWIALGEGRNEEVKTILVNLRAKLGAQLTVLDEYDIKALEARLQ